MIFAMVLSIFCCVNSQGVSAKVKNTVNTKKQGITYTKSIYMGTCDIWGKTGKQRVSQISWWIQI